jgi:activator of HSP90 ATPase
MTGGSATASRKVGRPFTAWDGYISGTNVVIEKFSKLVLNWRTQQFMADAADSVVEILFEPNSTGGTKLVLKHSNIPEGQPDYEDGWKKHYFTPMSSFFK